MEGKNVLPHVKQAVAAYGIVPTYKPCGTVLHCFDLGDVALDRVVPH